MGTILIGTCARGSDFHAQGKLCAQEINKTCQPLLHIFVLLHKNARTPLKALIRFFANIFGKKSNKSTALW